VLADATASDKRRRSESNRRWRICKQPPCPEIFDENEDSGKCAARGAAVDAKIVSDPRIANDPIDVDLDVLIERWPTLPAEVRKQIVELLHQPPKAEQ